MNTEYVVGDLMTIEPVVTSADARVEDAIRLIETYQISGLPVVDDAGRLVGVISQTDLVRLGDEPRVSPRRRRALRVADVMSTPPITVERLTRLSDAARLMHDRHVHRVVAIDDVGRPVGVLSSMDFVALYAEG